MANPTQIIVEPWCALGTEGTDYVIPPQSSPDPTVVTQDAGLPPVQSESLSTGGELTERYQWNGALYLYSSILAELQQGATFTSESTVISAISGYSKGSILNQFLSASSIIVPQLQVSLVDNNTNDFTVTPTLANDRTNWMQITNPVQSDYNKTNNLATNNLYTISIIDGYTLIYNDTTSIVYTLPAYGSVPVGFTVCIANQTGSITDGTHTITMTVGSSNLYYKIEAGVNGWVVDNQNIATYSQWATMAAITAIAPTASIGSNGWLSIPTSNLVGVNVIYQWGQTSAIVGSGQTSVTFPIAFSNGVLNIQVTANSAVNGGNNGAMAGNSTSSGFTVTGYGNQTCTYAYFAIGY